MFITIDVVADHIREGMRCDCTMCPIALAVNAKLAVGFRSSVGEDDIRIYSAAAAGSPLIIDGKSLAVIPAPPDVSRFVRAFDTESWRRFEPFSFILPIPPEFVRPDLTSGNA